MKLIKLISKIWTLIKTNLQSLYSNAYALNLHFKKISIKNVKFLYIISPIILFHQTSFSTNSTSSTEPIEENSVTFSAATVEPAPISTLATVTDDVQELKRRMDETDQTLTAQKKSLDTINESITTINANIESLKVIKQNTPIQTQSPTTANQNNSPPPSSSATPIQYNPYPPQQPGYCPCANRPFYNSQQSYVQPLDDENYIYETYNAPNTLPNSMIKPEETNSIPASQNPSNLIPQSVTNVAQPTAMPPSNSIASQPANNTDFKNTNQYVASSNNTDFYTSAPFLPQNTINNNPSTIGQSGFGANYVPPNLESSVTTNPTTTNTTSVNTEQSPITTQTPTAAVQQTTASVVSNLVGGLFGSDTSTNENTNSATTSNSSSSTSNSTSSTTGSLVGSLVSGLLGG